MPGWPLPPGQPAIYKSTPGGVTAPTLSSWQFYFNGVTFGASTSIGVTKVRGLGRLPAVNSQDQAFPRDTGEYVGLDSMGGRDPSIDLVLTSNVFTQMVTFGSAFAAGGVTPQPLWFQVPALPTLCSMVRPRNRDADWDTNLTAAAMWTPTLDFHANDPRLYAQAQTQDIWNSPNVTNAGNCEVRPVLVLNGPLNAPAVYNETISSSNPPGIVFQSSVSISSGDALVVDLSTPHTAVYHSGGVGPGGNSVFEWLDQSNTSWWTLVPGVNQMSVSVSGGSPSAGQVELWWASAYML